MRRIVAAINMTLDGFCDHTAVVPDEEVHQHYTDLINSGDVILYGRVTYQLMEYWRPFIKTPSGNQSMDDFARAIDRIEKVVFSHSLTDVDWSSARIAQGSIEDEIRSIRKQAGGDILVGSRSMIIALMKLNLIDEYQFCLHPVLAGNGLPLFEKLHERIALKLVNTKTFGSGAVMLYYHPEANKE